jgi:pyruvate dehydrogenase (quinone)
MTPAIRRTCIRALLPRLRARQDRAFLDSMLHEHARKLEQVVEAYTHDVEKLRPLHPEYVARVIDEEAAPDAVFTVDTGMCCSWAARYLTPNGRRRMVGSWVHGSMANALPQAVGAQVAYPGRQVLSLSGDGGLAMLLGELLTVRTHRLPVKVVVFNNSSLGMVRLEMMVAGVPFFETDHDPVDFAALAASMGFHTVRVEDPGELRAAVRSVLDHDGPRCSTSSPARTLSRSRRTSPRRSSRASRSPRPRSCSPVASARCCTWPGRTFATSRADSGAAGTTVG